MRINREQLVELLVQQTGLQKESVDNQLSELISKIKRAAEQGKHFEIERFGTFSMANDQLNFEPAEELYTEVNNKYAGMEPIELIGAYQDAEAAEEQQTTKPDDDRAQETVWPEEEDIWGWEETESQKETEREEDESQSGEEPDEEQPAEWTDETSSEEEIPAEQADDEPAPEQKSEKQEPEPKQQEETVEDERAKPEPVVAEEGATGTETEEQQDEEEEQEPQPALSTTTKTPADVKKESRRRHKQKSTQNSTNTILVAAAMVVIIAAVATGLWFMTDPGTDSESGQGQQAAISTPSNQMPGNPSGNISQDQPSVQTQQGEESAENGLNEQQSSSASSKAENNSEPEPQKQVAQKPGGQSAASVYGLKGELNSNANDGYTIVVYSMQNQQNAKELYNDLNQEGYRTMLVPAIIDGNRFWRVAIGQFPSIDQAQSTAGELPEPHSNNFFIKRIR